MLNVLFQEGKEYLNVYHFGTQNSDTRFLTFSYKNFQTYKSKQTNTINSPVPIICPQQLSACSQSHFIYTTSIHLPQPQIILKHARHYSSVNISRYAPKK